jgi:Ca2+-binding EF-hand superfamily protein
MLMTKKMNEKEDPETLKEAFRILDADGSGSISREEMRSLMVSFSKMGENVPDGGEIELKPS